MSDKSLRLLLTGDVMTGRGIDQALAQSSEPTLYEEWVHDARDYVRLAERSSGPIGRPLSPAQLWGDALPALERLQPQLRIVNLETSITTANTPWPRKGIHYRMHPGNVDVLRAARIDACVLANNHVLDWGRDGLGETLRTLHEAGIPSAGAGSDRTSAWAPLRLATAGGTDVLLFALAFATSGAPATWAATAQSAGIAWLAEPTRAAADEWLAHIAMHRRAGDCVIASMHWGGNWVRAVPAAHRDFAHRLIDSGQVDLVHGHSSHHPLPIEVHRGKLILYGCGDLLNDYEGIGPHGDLRSDVGCLYCATLAVEGARIESLEIVPLQTKRFRLTCPDAVAQASLERVFGAIEAERGVWSLRWEGPR